MAPFSIGGLCFAREAKARQPMRKRRKSDLHIPRCTFQRCAVQDAGEALDLLDAAGGRYAA